MGGTKHRAVRVTRGEWQGSAAGGASWGDCAQNQSEAGAKGSVDKFNQTVSSLTSGTVRKNGWQGLRVYAERTTPPVQIIYPGFFFFFFIFMKDDHAPYFKRRGILSRSRLDLIFQNKLCSCQTGCKSGNIEFNTATGCIDGKNTGSVAFLQQQHKEVTAPWNQHARGGFWGGRERSTRLFPAGEKQLQQHILASEYLCRTYSTVMAFYLFGFTVRMIWMFTGYVQLLCHRLFFFIISLSAPSLSPSPSLISLHMSQSALWYF